MGTVRVGLVLCSLAGYFRRCAWGYSGYLLILLARLNGSLSLAILVRLPSLSEWLSMNVVTSLIDLQLLIVVVLLTEGSN